MIAATGVWQGYRIRKSELANILSREPRALIYELLAVVCSCLRGGRIDFEEADVPWLGKQEQVHVLIAKALCKGLRYTVSLMIAEKWESFFGY
uniref:Uncharacterized protein n=1 Tax=Tanacetum cinerariifolium TaxID=118510 RepID=A0A6L2NZT4_TANCI|nr:hypothetical protein [Tanacetum cinerariifolium]